MPDLLQPVISADDCDPAELDSFLRSYFTAEKCDFLRDFGAWQARGNAQRWLIRYDGRIAAYSALMPTAIWAGEIHTAYWWIDLYIHPDFRGLGLQRLFDEKVKALGLILGVPNATAAEIHRKHGWQVRDDARVLLLPLLPRWMPAIKRQNPFIQALATLAQPLFGLWTSLLKMPKSNAYELENPNADSLAAVYAQYRGQFITTERSAEYLQWRFFDSPQHQEYRYWGVAGTEGLELVAITREIRREGQVSLRIVDIFGNLENTELLHQVLLKIVQAYLGQKLVQITAIASYPALKQALQRLGFLPLGVFRFCWIGADLGGKPFHWSLADSDSDLV